jgi:predicted enzyme involved in methoxymalonyl-ACP biosynthesis
MADAVRLVIWDLDETFWEGTLTEGGIRKYVDENHNIVIELARRGILSSICSKNDMATVMPILAQKGIDEYFIFQAFLGNQKVSGSPN